MERKKFLDRIATSEGEEKTKALMDYSQYLQQTDPLESVKQAKLVLEIARAQNDIQLEINAMINIANAYICNSDFPKAEHWINFLLRTGTKNKIPKALGTAYALKARVDLSQNNATSSLQNMLLALEYFLETNDQFDLLSCYNGLGIIHLMKTELDEAYHYYQLALQIAEKIGSNAKHSIRVNIGIIQTEQKKYKEALESNFISLEYFRENDQKTSEATALYNIGFCYYQLEELTDSLTYLEKSYALSKDLNEKYLLSKRCNAVATTLVKMGELDKALPYIEESVKLAEKYDLQWDMALGYETYSLYYKERGDYQQAYDYLQKVLSLKDKINKENTQGKIAELEAKYKTQIYKLQNTELDESNKAMSNQITELNESLSGLQTTYLSLQKDFEKVVERVNAQDDLLSSQSRMSLMGGMISAIAHQWKQPLNVIWVLVQAIDDSWHFDELNEEFMDNQVKQIGEQVHYMADTVNDFSKFFKPEYVQEYSVAETIEKALKLLAYMLKSSGISLIKELDDNCRLSGNPNELNQVIINIINNAQEAILRDKIIAPEIRIRMNCNKEQISITIYNKGNHIKPENLEKIFEPYYTTRGKEGTGIGLQICRQIIENKYNGTINANNCEGGVEFVIEMPN
ncbi:MAG: tetratricopeptide repeat-containing sensor histidine kinase [Candidatus Stygibacter australis]|nr:tetratricopeptide repeat-containing sensor histidine kinase [Candidatus Stygibacter australis]MDP8321191.1 tetratricopeptide repeat-containing sensor histidine kinase [Candidatus Stygibacter australis]